MRTRLKTSSPPVGSFFSECCDTPVFGIEDDSCGTTGCLECTTSEFIVKKQPVDTNNALAASGTLKSASRIVLEDNFGQANFESLQSLVFNASDYKLFPVGLMVSYIHTVFLNFLKDNQQFGLSLGVIDRLLTEFTDIGIKIAKRYEKDYDNLKANVEAYCKKNKIKLVSKATPTKQLKIREKYDFGKYKFDGIPDPPGIFEMKKDPAPRSKAARSVMSKNGAAPKSGAPPKSSAPKSSSAEPTPTSMK
ncbi:unnamed protein product [Caenorhabditis auriculariae]|uniref:Uncharacterized protein n=1 Tax=Caenorhabditis auriculariae TaxID=2777116 RepID=A0A8S1HUY7_9PELO|nr:unnamed protein product [Caenorhabditis auriculariae]